MRFSPSVIASILAASFLAAGCEDRVPPVAAGRDLVRPAFGLAVNVPPGWTFRDLSGDIVLELFPSPHEGAAPPPAGRSLPATAGEGPPASPSEIPPAKPSLVIHALVIDRDGVSLDRWADDAIKESQQLQSDLEVVSRTPGHLADGREALLVVLKNPRSLQPLVQRMLLVVTERRAYGLLATAAESELAAADEVVKKCFDSFVVW